MWDAGIAVDEPSRNLAMLEKLLLRFPILSGPDGDVIKAYGVWNPGDGGVAKPALFLIRPDWSVAFQYVGTDFADRPTDEELFSVAAEATQHA